MKKIKKTIEEIVEEYAEELRSQGQDVETMIVHHEDFIILYKDLEQDDE